MEKYFYSYLDKGRILKYFVENKQVELNNEFKIIQVTDERVKACSAIDLNLDSLVYKVKRIQNEFLS